MTEPPTGWTTPGSHPAPEVPQWTSPPSYGNQSPWAATDATWQVAPQPGVIPLRPLGLGEILDGAVKIIRRYPRPTLGLSAAIALVVTVVNVVLTLALDHRPAALSSDGSFSSGFSASGGSLSSSLPGYLLSLLASLVLTGALVSVVGKAVLGQPADPAEIARTVRGRLWALLGVALLSGLIIALPLTVTIVLAIVLNNGPLAFLLILGGVVGSVYLYIRLSLASAVLVLEKAGVVLALRRSGVLVKGSFWRILGILLLTSLIVGVLNLIVNIPVVLIAVIATGGGVQGTAFLVATKIGAGLASVVIQPFASGVRALLYVDRRMRAEGLDVALQAASTAPPAL